MPTPRPATHISLAVLDDYPSLAPQHFTSLPLPPESITLTSYPDTLSPYTPQGLDHLVSRLSAHNVISTMRERTPFPRELLARLPNLRLLLTTGMRNASIDLAAASELGIIVAGTKVERLASDTSALSTRPPVGYDDDNDPILPPPASHSTVIQHTWALILDLASRISHDDRALRQSSPSTAPPPWQSGFVVPLHGLTLGILGLGKLGLGVARIGITAFGMKVVAWSSTLTQAHADALAASVHLPPGSFEVVPGDVGKLEVCRRADILSLHYVLSARSKGLLGARELAAMKRRAFLVNTSRAGLVDEEALIAALRDGRIAGAGLDVFPEEPLPRDSMWRRAAEWANEDRATQVVLSPHMGYGNQGTLNAWYREQALDLGRWWRGEELVGRMN